MSDKVYAIIPARSGSKGLPDKNLRELAGHSLLAWSIKMCLKCSKISKVIVSTDSEKYAELAVKSGAEVPFLRPAEISLDHSTDYDFVKHALSYWESHSKTPKRIVHIRPTTPLRDYTVVDEAIDKFDAQTGFTSLRSVQVMSESAYKTFEVDKDGLLKPVGLSHYNIDDLNNARQTYAPTYSANGYVDVLSVPYIKNNGALHGSRVMPFITENVTEVDTIEDFAFLEYQVQRRLDLVQQYFGDPNK